MFERFFLAITFSMASSYCLAQDEPIQPTASKQPYVHFDMDSSKEGLEYLNISDANIVEIKEASTSSPLAVGSSRVVTEQSANNPVRFILSPIFNIAFRPLFFAGSATDFPENDKTMTNRPTGRPGNYNDASSRNLGVYHLERFSESEQINFKISDKTKDSDESGANPTKPREITKPSGNASDWPKIKPYSVDLKPKDNTNRPSGRASAGRGNARVLYPAHPNEP